MRINGGTLKIMGDYYLCPPDDSATMLAYANLDMKDPNDVVEIGGSLITATRGLGSNESGMDVTWTSQNLTAGTIIIHGDLVQKGVYGQFSPAGTKVVFAGDNAHKVHFESANSCFKSLEVESGKLNAEGFLAFSRLNSDLDITVVGDRLITCRGMRLYGHDMVVNGNLVAMGKNPQIGGEYEECQIVLGDSYCAALEGGLASDNGGSMTVNGDLWIAEGYRSLSEPYEKITTVDINNGSLRVTGDCHLETPDDLNEGETAAKRSALCVCGSKGRASIDGDLVIRSLHMTEDYLSGGVLRVGGDIVCASGCALKSGSTVILDGKGRQHLDLASGSTIGKLILAQPKSEYELPQACWEQLAVLGDVNEDEIIDVRDLVLSHRYCAGLANLSMQGLLNADKNLDGEVTMKDIVGMAKQLIADE